MTAEAAATSAFQGLERLREIEKSLTVKVGTADRKLDLAISDVLTPTLDSLIAEMATLADELSARRQLLEHIREKILSVESTVYSRVFRAVYLERPPVDAAAIAPELARWIAMAEALANDPDAPCHD